MLRKKQEIWRLRSLNKAKGPRSGRGSVIKFLQEIEPLVKAIEDVTPLSHNGVVLGRRGGFRKYVSY